MDDGEECRLQVPQRGQRWNQISKRKSGNGRGRRQALDLRDRRTPSRTSAELGEEGDKAINEFGAVPPLAPTAPLMAFVS
jgi:hypothetical protein